jgi:hypothetical protein
MIIERQKQTVKRSSKELTDRERCDVMGVGTDQEFQESVAVLRRGYDQLQTGQTRPVKDALDDLGKRYGLSR